MAPTFYTSAGDVIHAGIGWVPAEALADLFVDLETQRTRAVDRGLSATAEWLRFQIVSLSKATADAAEWRKASRAAPQRDRWAA